MPRPRSAYDSDTASLSSASTRQPRRKPQQRYRSPSTDSYSRPPRSRSPSADSYDSRPRKSRHSSYQSKPGGGEEEKSKFKPLAQGVLAVGIITIAANFVSEWMKRKHAASEARARRERRREFERAKARRRREDERRERAQEEREKREAQFEEDSVVPESRMIGAAPTRERSRSRSRQRRPRRLEAPGEERESGSDEEDYREERRRRAGRTRSRARDDRS